MNGATTPRLASDDSPLARVIWLTGLSGAGKTTIAREMSRKLRDGGVPSLLLDGDEVRAACGGDYGHDPDGRLRNAYRMARLAKLAADQGLVVTVSTMSLFHEVHAWNRENLPGYFEVLLDVDVEVCRRRDPKNLYRDVARKVQRHVGGVDVRVEYPLDPHLKLDNNADLSEVGGVAGLILEAAGL
jgi:adenylylsulfate kinase-like enzyme